ncbi:MAG: selenocysteine-specific translation elongation factor [Planctomycetes bacterium GWF2_42_9]|nr:MAG: selenocysteine-specific translation elongation factor [Planctomycetes bacterium GWF2_42_9]
MNSAAKQINITLGTAGHIDHGKTALVKNLTGCDTDYLKEEKERGMSIELGFAPCILSNLEVGIVDVPGHENFIKTMVAGAAGMDGVIFVVAADDGVMPQTREHLGILTLLGIEHGMVALTKSDCVQPEQLQNVIAKLKDFLKGTFLENAPILPVSNITGAGFDAFYGALQTLVNSIKPKRVDGFFRLPIERSFSIKGYGTVVAGVPVSGSAKIGDEVTLLPQNLKGRIKTIQVYKHSADAVLAGQCAAINIPQLEHKIIERGNVIVANDCFVPQSWYLCRLSLLDNNQLFLKNGQEVKFHTGTSEILASVYLMQGDQLPSGQEAIVQLRLNSPCIAAPRDRFIIRSLSPVHTIGGGMIIDSLPAKLKRTLPNVQSDVEEWAQAVPEERKFVEFSLKKIKSYIASAKEISNRTKIPAGYVETFLKDMVLQHTAIELEKMYIHLDTVNHLEQNLLDLVADFHKNSPQTPGIDPELLYQASEFEKSVFNLIVARLKEKKLIVTRGNKVALPTHREEIPEAHRVGFEKIEKLFVSRLFNPPANEELAQILNIPKDKIDALVKLLIEYERLVVVEKDLFFHTEAIQKARQLLVDCIKNEGMLESVKFKYILDTSRKYAIPLLDYFDRIGLTRNVGHTRYLK